MALFIFKFYSHLTFTGIEPANKLFTDAGGTTELLLSYLGVSWDILTKIFLSRHSLAGSGEKEGT